MSQTISTAIMNQQKATDRLGRNLAHADVTGFSEQQTVFVAGSGNSGSAPLSVQRNTMDFPGEAVAGVDGDMALDGQGFFVVKRGDETVFSKDGSFRINGINKEIQDANGGVLMVWELGADGEIPAGNTSLSTLVPMNTKKLLSGATATTTIKQSYNLKQEQKVLDGPGSVINLSVHSVLNPADLIAPGENSTGLFDLNNQVKLTPSNGDAGAVGVESVFQYGGLVLSKQPTAAQGQSIYTATGVGDLFNVSPEGVNATDDNQVTHNSGFSIRVGEAGDIYEFRATSAANQADQGLFNSITTLKNAINSHSKGRLRANIVDGRLLIAAKNANDGLTFTALDTPAGRTDVHVMLGLVDVAAKGVNDPERYASISEFRDKINDVSGLRSEIVNGKDLRFGAKEATHTLSIKAESFRPRNYRRAYVSSDTIDTQRRFLVNIESPAHGLVNGDHVRLSGGLAINPGPAAINIADGVYRVTRISNDRFAISSLTELDTAGNEPLAAGAAFNITTANTANLTWRKVEGNVSQHSVAGAHNTAVGALAGNYSTVGVTLTGAPDQFEAIAANDIVYIEGSSVLQNGHYLVTAAAGANISVRARGNGVTPDLTAAGMAVVVAGGNVADANIKMTRVSKAAMETYPISVPANSNVVTVNKSDGHVYQKNDVVMFTDFAVGTDFVEMGNAANNVKIRQNTPYTITAVTDTSFSFELPTADVTGGGTANPVRIGYISSHDGAGFVNAAGTIMGADAQIQNIGKQFSGMGITTNEKYFKEPRPATYDGALAAKNMASGAVEPHQTNTGIVYDSFGSKQEIHISVVKLSDLKWSAEIYVKKDANGKYPVSGSNQLAYGNITFDGNGKIIDVADALKNITCNWNNGATPSTISLDFGLNGGDNGVTMYSGNYYTRYMEPNGNSAGAFTGYNVQPNGDIIAIFSNGETKRVAKVPIASFSSPNEMLDLGQGYWTEAAGVSGAAVLNQPGVNDAPKIIPNHVNASNVDKNGTLIRIGDSHHSQQLLMKVLSAQKQTNKLAIDLL